MPENYAEAGVSDKNSCKGDDKSPRSAEAGHHIGDPLSECHLFLNHLVGVAAGAHAYQLLRGMKLAAEHGQHVHPGHWFPLKKNGDVMPVHFQAGGFDQRNGIGLMRCLLQHGGEAKKFAD